MLGVEPVWTALSRAASLLERDASDSVLSRPWVTVVGAVAVDVLEVDSPELDISAQRNKYIARSG